MKVSVGSKVSHLIVRAIVSVHVCVGVWISISVSKEFNGFNKASVVGHCDAAGDNLTSSIQMINCIIDGK